MTRVLMLDLGDTLVHGNQVFDHVPAALTVLQQFESSDGVPLQICLVSDWINATDLASDTEVALLFKNYLEILNEFELTRFFEPVDKRVTLSTHVGQDKPARIVFDKALERLGVDTELTDTLFVTEKATHIEACRLLGMQVLQFGADAGDFDNWVSGPLAIANAMSPVLDSNVQLAAELIVQHETDGAEVLSVTQRSDRAAIDAQAMQWFPLNDDALGDAKGVLVQLPVNVSLETNKRGAVTGIQKSQPSENDRSEAFQFVKSLLTHGQIAAHGPETASGATHVIEEDEHGLRRLIRKRFAKSGISDLLRKATGESNPR